MVALTSWAWVLTLSTSPNPVHQALQVGRPAQVCLAGSDLLHSTCPEPWLACIGITIIIEGLQVGTLQPSAGHAGTGEVAS